ncbi:MAG: hypothetical protein LBG43_06630 [Treponema sp.]|nr:hypothetical protein [Treponema sp.]
MRKFWLICLAGLLAIGVSLTGCAGSPAPATESSVAAEEAVDEAAAAEEVVEEEAVEEAAE